MANDIHHGHEFVQLEHMHHSKSPFDTLSSLGQGSFEEALPRQREPHVSREDKRDERLTQGVVKFRIENGVPDVGGLGWRSKTGHLLKNQAYYGVVNENVWNNPTHAGTNTWKAWHGPKLRTDAPLMERLDTLDEQDAEWEARKVFVNTRRVQTLDAFYNLKQENAQAAKAAQWAPHKRCKREVSDEMNTFQADLDVMPKKELKKVMTPAVLHRDREAVRLITHRLQTEETWKAAWKHMEQERRLDIRSDFEQRRCYNDMLEQMAGQPSRPANFEHQMPNNCTDRTHEMSRSRSVPTAKDITQLTDYRGLLHADNINALEVLYPGSGHAGVMDVKARAKEYAKPGWSAPNQPLTPTYGKNAHAKRPGRGSVIADRSQTRLASVSAPVSQTRLSRVPQRCDDHLLTRHSTMQFLATEAPPAPDQNSTLLCEDWSPKTTLTDIKRMSMRPEINFARTDHSSTSTFDRRQEDLPPPRRSYVYPVLAHTAEATQGFSKLRQSSSCGALPKASAPSVNSICTELDKFERGMHPVPHLGNFFKQKHAQSHGSLSASRIEAGQ